MYYCCPQHPAAAAPHWRGCVKRLACSWRHPGLPGGFPGSAPQFPHSSCLRPAARPPPVHTGHAGCFARALAPAWTHTCVVPLTQSNWHTGTLFTTHCQNALHALYTWAACPCVEYRVRFCGQTGQHTILSSSKAATLGPSRMLTASTKSTKSCFSGCGRSPPGRQMPSTTPSSSAPGAAAGRGCP